MFTPEKRYKIHWEITDLCNLKCPMCPRTETLDHCKVVKEVQNSQFFFDDVKKLMPENFLKKVKRIDFCGNFGDPCIARDFYEICEYLTRNHNITIMASTNGSMRNPSWWKKLGELLAGSESWFEFHIDGLQDTNHLYRIGANWEKVIANAQAFIDGGGRADWHYILFKHNQHQLGEAHTLANKMGFSHFVPTGTGRFPQGDVFKYMHPDGDFRLLEKATITLEQGIEKTQATNPQDQDSSPPSAAMKKLAYTVEDNTDIHQENTQQETSINGITCKSAAKNRFFIDALGYVAPCCWISNRDIKKPGDMLKSITISGRKLDDFNIRKRPIEDILSNELFSNIFPQFWQLDALATCRKKCGIKHRNVKIKMKL